MNDTPNDTPNDRQSDRQSDGLHDGFRARPSRRGVLAGLAAGLGAGLGLAAASPAAAAGVDTAPSAPSAPSRHAARRLRVATFNIHHGASPADVLDLERVARVIAALRVDVVGLQEVDRHWSERSGLVDQPAWLGRRLRMHHVYGANLDLDPAEPGAPRRQYGTAILSRWPVLSWRNTHLPLFPGHEQRGLLQATLAVRGTRLTAAVTHLQHNDNVEREQQAARIVELLGGDPRRTVLVGDLNARPGAPEIRTLTDALPDPWPRVGDGDGFTYGSVDPTSRIDYVLASRDLRPLAAEVVTLDPEASDHLPVVAELLMPR
ncbi:endonuclease/exonuclease/phosphatase family protein [Streptomyces sp. 4N509B]|uniref:endonuclease/exonuclease/phosphatase family protein n=1 Tax=Streptomyces sp. 4N509B TaxID=3457413 RepID=UPI003FD502A4